MSEKRTEWTMDQQGNLPVEEIGYPKLHATNRQLNYKGINHKLENGVLEILEYHIHTCHKLWTETCETRQTFTVCFK